MRYLITKYILINKNSSTPMVDCSPITIVDNWTKWEDNLPKDDTNCYSIWRIENDNSFKFVKGIINFN